MYVNMHELATMAATKAQEMNFPPPPPDLTTIPPENQEKVSDLRPDNGLSSVQPFVSREMFVSLLIL